MSFSEHARGFLIGPDYEMTDFGHLPAVESSWRITAPSHNLRKPSVTSDQEFLIPRKPIPQSSGYLPRHQTLTKRTNTGLSSTIVADIANHSYKETLRRVQLFLTRSGPAQQYRRTGSVDPGVKQSRFTGWRFGVLCACFGVAVCLLAELIFLITALAVDIPKGGIGTLYSGSCEKVRNLTIWVLLPLNVMGTILIGCSNYAMQCLGASTRKDIDDAHSSGHYVNIGISSVQNLTYLATWK